MSPSTELQQALWLNIKTTSLHSKTAAVVQIAGLLEVGGEVIDTIDLLCAPHKGCSVEPKALELAGGDMNILNELPPARKVVQNFIKFIQTYADGSDPYVKLILCGYNTSFCFSVMDAFFYRNSPRTYLSKHFMTATLDVMNCVALARYKNKIKLDEIKGNSLVSMCEHFNVRLENPLDGIQCASATRQLFHQLDFLMADG